MATKRVSKDPSKNKSLLVSFARTIGSTLGAVAAKTDSLSMATPKHSSRKKSATKTNKTRKKNAA
jgi:hypothetical protein